MTDFIYTAHKPDINGLIPYSQEEHGTWQILYNRQIEIIKNRACSEYLAGIIKLNLIADRISQPLEVSSRLKECTGWEVYTVPALINFKDFFELLANKKFPAASFMRRRIDLDYLKEPDIFHEIFGHCPLLTNQDFASFTQAVGKFGLTLNKEDRIMLARLYWFSVEFGLIRTQTGLRIYGAGILSSKTETIYALESNYPLRRDFNLLEVLRMPYRYDNLQKIYYIINSFGELFNMINGDKLLKTFNQAKNLGMLNLIANEEKVQIA